MVSPSGCLAHTLIAQGPNSHTLGLGTAPCFSSPAAKPDRPGRAGPGSHTRAAPQPVGSSQGIMSLGAKGASSPGPASALHQPSCWAWQSRCPWPAWTWRGIARGPGIPQTPPRLPAGFSPGGPAPELQIKHDSVMGEAPNLSLPSSGGLGWPTWGRRAEHHHPVWAGKPLYPSAPAYMPPPPGSLLDCSNPQQAGGPSPSPQSPRHAAHMRGALKCSGPHPLEGTQGNRLGGLGLRV